MAIDLLITEEGFKKMLTNGLSSSITKFSITDQYKIYGLNSSPTLPSFTGTKTNLGNSNPSCNLSRYGGISQDPLSEEITSVLNKRVGVKFFSSDCDGGFDLNTVTIKFNMARYFNQLTTFLTQTYNYTQEGLTQKIYDYTYSVIEEEDVVNGGFNVLDTLQDIGINVGLNSNADTGNYLKVNNRYNTEGGTFNDKRGQQLYSSPFHLNFVSNSVGSMGIPGSGLKLTMMPDYFGYTIDGGFQKLSIANQGITTNGINNYNQIIPTARFGGVDYLLGDSNTYNTSDPLLGQFAYGFKDGNNVSLLKALIDSGILFMKTTGTNDNGVYKIPINYKVFVGGDDNFNNIYANNNYGGEVNLELIYDPTDIGTTNIIEIN